MIISVGKVAPGREVSPPNKRHKRATASTGRGTLQHTHSTRTAGGSAIDSRHRKVACGPRQQAQALVRRRTVNVSLAFMSSAFCLAATSFLEPRFGLRYSSHTARSGLGLARVVRLFVWLRHANGMLSTTPLDPCAFEMRAQGGNKRRTGLLLLDSSALDSEWRVPPPAQHIRASVRRYPGYLRLPPLIQTSTQSSTPQTAQIGYLLTEALT